MPIQKRTNRKTPLEKKKEKEKNENAKPEDLIPEQNYCRRCMKILPSINFYRAVNLELDKNNLFSVCKSCCDEIFESHYRAEHNFEKALYKTCRTLDVAYIASAVEATKTHVSNRVSEKKDINSYFGIYKSKMSSFSRVNKDLPLTFQENPKAIIDNSLDESSEPLEMKEYLKSFWGESFSFEEYSFLESELNRYKRTHKSDTAAEESLLRLICITELNIRKKMNGGEDASVEIKRLQDLMKSAAIDPAKTTVAGSGRSLDTFSNFIKIIEENEPAEVYKDKALFRDFDNIDWYFKKYVTRPLQNFITQSRLFNIDDPDDNDDEDESDDMDVQGVIKNA